MGGFLGNDLILFSWLFPKGFAKYPVIKKNNQNRILVNKIFVQQEANSFCNYFDYIYLNTIELVRKWQMNLRDFFCVIWDVLGNIFKVSFFLLRTLCCHLGFFCVALKVDQNQHVEITKQKKRCFYLKYRLALGFLFSCLFLTNTSFIFIFVTMKFYLICLVWRNKLMNIFLKTF